MQETQTNNDPITKDFPGKYRQSYGRLRTSVFMSMENLRTHLKCSNISEIEEHLLQQHQFMQKEIKHSKDQICQFFREDNQQLQQEIQRLQQQVDHLQHQNQQHVKASDFLCPGLVCAFAFVGATLYFKSSHENYKIASLFMTMAVLLIFSLFAKKSNPNITHFLNKFGLFVDKKTGGTFQEIERYPENDNLASQVVASANVDIKTGIDTDSQASKLVHF